MSLPERLAFFCFIACKVCVNKINGLEGFIVFLASGVAPAVNKSSHNNT